MPTIIMHTQGSDGDVLPFLRIAASLRGRGHETVVCTHSPYRDRATATGARFSPVDDDEGYRTLRAQARQLMSIRRPAELADFYRRTGLTERLHAEVADILARSVPGSTVLVGRHTSSDAIKIAAEVTGAPLLWVALSPTQLMAAPVAAAHHALGLAPGIERVRSSYGLPPVTDWREWLDGASSFACLWPRWFEAAGTATVDQRSPLGFVLPDGPDDAGGDPLPLDVAALATLAASGERVVLVTGGTGTMLHERFYGAAIHGVARSGARPLVVCAFPESLPHPLPPGTVHVPRVGFAAVMPWVSAIVHHGGLGTLGRALAAGTPQLLLAHAADRRDNGERLHRSGLASWLPLTAWSPERVSAALAQLPSRTAIRATLSALSPGGKVDTGLPGAVETIESRLPDGHAAPQPAGGPRR